MKFAPSGKLRAFTLVELLVVIAIIAILAGLLLPALATSKQKALTAGCLDNQKQLQLCWQMYTDDNQGTMPPNYILSTGIPAFISQPGSWLLGNAQLDTNTANLQKGLLFRYNQSVGIYRCPADKSRVDKRRDLLRTRSLSLNLLLNTHIDGAVRGRTKSRESQLIDPPPAGVMTFVDVLEECIDSADFAMHLAPEEEDKWEHLPAQRHNQGANLAFADGRAERFRWLAKKKFVAFPTEIAGAKDRIDFNRLKACMPK